jgi:hypothetical protein
MAAREHILKESGRLRLVVLLDAGWGPRFVVQQAGGVTVGPFPTLAEAATCYDAACAAAASRVAPAPPQAPASLAVYRRRRRHRRVG